MQFFLPCVLTASLFVNSEGHKGLRSHLQTEGFVRTLKFKYTLRICDAYASEDKLEVIKGKESLLEGMSYKECSDISTDLKSGDKIEFKIEGTEAGTFSIQDLPQNDATLLLMITRHDAVSRAVAFESHVFSSLANSQIAVLDMYKGAEKSTMKIQDKTEAKLSRSEDLRYDSVVAVNPGKYDCVLVGADGAEKARTDLVAVPKESYVAFRTGLDVQDKEGKGYKEDIVVYPKPPPVKDNASGASLMALLVALGVMVLQ